MCETLFHKMLVVIRVQSVLSLIIILINQMSYVLEAGKGKGEGEMGKSVLHPCSDGGGEGKWDPSYRKVIGGCLPRAPFPLLEIVPQSQHEAWKISKTWNWGSGGRS